jgi:hypothetical protein
MSTYRVNAEDIRNVIYRANENLLNQYPNCPTEYKIKLWEERYNVKFIPHNDNESLYDGVDVDIVFPGENDYLAFVLKYA